MKLIDISYQSGAITGYLNSTHEENWQNYLMEFFSQEEVLKIKEYLLSLNIQELVVLKNLSMDLQDKGKGIGSKLLIEFINEASGVPILLVCDNLEIQKEGFVLSTWYESYGFETLPFKCLSGPLMLLR